MAHINQSSITEDRMTQFKEVTLTLLVSMGLIAFMSGKIVLTILKIFSKMKVQIHNIDSGKCYCDIRIYMCRDTTM